MKSYITLVLDAAKVQMHLWVVWKKKERIMRLNDEDMVGFNDEEKQAWQNSYKSHETKVEKAFNSRMTEVFKVAKIDIKILYICIY